MADLTTDADASNGEFLYLAEDAQQILSIAIARQTESGELSRAQLLEIADELGISADTIAEAEREWDTKKYELADQKLFDSQRKQRFQHDLAQFLIVGSGVLVFQLVTGGWLWNWLLYLVFGPWGLQLSWNAWRIYRSNEYMYQQEFQRWRRQQQMKRAVGGAVRRLFGPSRVS
ncbi:2TM domain-containing protein [Nodosilinea sp. LEGE 07088]|uniref:2TM domain-containing protein n=1 Tax=Nodosilinea sp. LEGE 07088 TaxID=2777968 RepID=UPI001881E17D|nr:2TM domain-containing protein [Nodosilinea sp. LEGE 07088]MBE9136559.1 2TM domain-containing protein [Nodosilinea sp. LEGE 07088]